MKKYLIYKTSGGINHMTIQINKAIYLSKISNRYLIIDCLGDAFRSDFNEYFNIPNFQYSTNYDCIYEDDTIDKNMFEFYVTAEAKWVSPCTYYLKNKLISINANDVLNSDEKIIYCSWIGNISEYIPWYIKVNKNIVDKISVNKINEKYIGVHYRNTDMKHDLNKFIPEIYSLFNQCNIIYLATDDYTAFDRLNDLLNNKFKIIQYTTPFNANGRHIHYENPNKNEVIINTLIDMYHLIHSTYFIPSINSSLSSRVIELKNNDNFFN